MAASAGLGGINACVNTVDILAVSFLVLEWVGYALTLEHSAYGRNSLYAFDAFGYLGWFASPWVMFATTAAVVFVTWRRQFVSNARRAMGN